MTGGDRISLCVVARNEAAFIGDTIASARPVVDEIVVVDTGSSDATRAIARSSGAVVVDAPWPGDLASAHDLPVEQATGEWVLALDGDEVLDVASAHRVRALVDAGDHDGYRLPVRNYSHTYEAKWRPADPHDPLARGAMGYIPTWPVRLFRRRPEYRYSGRLHQCVSPAIRHSGGHLGDADVVIHHYGFIRFDRLKSPLYRKLAAGQVAAAPDDPRSWVELGVVLLGENTLHSLPAATQAFRIAWSRGDRTDAAFLLGTSLVHLGYPEAALEYLDASIAANPQDRAGHYDRADAWEASGLAYEDLGRRDDAEPAYRRTLALRADSPIALHNLAGLLMESGAISEASELLDELMVRHQGSAAFWSLLGRMQLRRKDPDAASAAFATALDIRPEALGARVNYAVALRRAGHPRKAARAYATAAERLGSVEAGRLDLQSRLPPRYRKRPARTVDGLGSGLVVHITGTLAGGSGRVLADGVAALAGRPQLVVCEDASPHDGQRLRAELEAAGVTVLTIDAQDELALVLRRLRPAVVIHHWTARRLQRLQVGNERWICIGHVPLAMPSGYDAYVVNSRFHRQHQAHLPPERINFIPNGVALERFRPRNVSGSSPVTIAMLSRLDPGKFPRRLLDHLPALDGARVLIAGYGARRHELEPEIRARGLTRSVRFVGPLGSADVPEFLAGADFGLHLTETHQELCSMAILEMLAAGLPIVAEPKGGLSEMVTDGDNGFLCTDEGEVRTRVRALIDSPTLRSSMGRASRAVAARFHINDFHRALRRLVQEVEGRPAAADPAREPASRRASDASPRPAAGRATRSYLVCATPRSGSSLLCDLLAGSGLAGQPTELFGPPTRRTLPALWGCGDLGAYVEELLRRHATPNGVFGAKVQLDALQALLGGLAARDGAAGERSPAVLAASFPRLRYVWIRRRDRLRQAVSWERASQTDLWEHTGAPPPIVLPRPRFDADAIQRRIEAIEQQELWWAAWFDQAGAEPVEVFYEDLADDQPAEVRRILDALGIDVPEPLWLTPARLRRQADESSERWVQRFRELAGKDRVMQPTG